MLKEDKVFISTKNGFKRLKLKMNQIIDIAANAKDRYHLWTNFVNFNKCTDICEIGVFKGEFAQILLNKAPSIENYYLIDPWRNLSNWNKPANVKDDEFKRYYDETISRTKFAKEKTTILRGKTLDVADRIKAESLDFVYVDGDHTLRGITIDLLSIWNKVKPTGFIAGDDFCSSIWQHSKEFEPTLVFPFALYFAEAMQTRITALPYNQFLISKEQNGFEFIDLTNGNYSVQNLKELINKPDKSLKKSKNENVLSKLFNRINKF